MAISNFSLVRRMLDETLFGEVADKFKSVAGGISQSSSMMTQLRDHDRYIYSQFQKNDIWIGLGYWMNSFDDAKDYPEVRFVIEIAPKSPKYVAIKNLMKEICSNNPAWGNYNLDIPSSWAGIYVSESLSQVVSSGDHITEIKKFFISSIELYRRTKSSFNGLI
jgi:hypothetical protein